MFTFRSFDRTLDIFVCGSWELFVWMIEQIEIWRYPTVNTHSLMSLDFTIHLKRFHYSMNLLNVLHGCKMALRTLDFSQVKPTIAMLRERRARAPKAVRARFHWCDRKAKCACFAVTHLRYNVVMGPWKQRSFHQYSYYTAISVTSRFVLRIFSVNFKVGLFTIESRQMHHY